MIDGRCRRVRLSPLRSSQVLDMPSVSAQALATAESGDVLPIIVAQPPLAMKSPWLHELIFFSSARAASALGCF